MNYNEVVEMVINALMLVMEMIVAGGMICSLATRPEIATEAVESKEAAIPEAEEIEMDVAKVVLVEKLNYRQLRKVLAEKGIKYSGLNKVQMLEALEKSRSVKEARRLVIAA
jgi:hypothetical protein